MKVLKSWLKNHWSELQGVSYSGAYFGSSIHKDLFDVAIR